MTRCLHDGPVIDTGKFDDLTVILKCTICGEEFAVDKLEFETCYEFPNDDNDDYDDYYDDGYYDDDDDCEK